MNKADLPPRDLIRQASLSVQRSGTRSRDDAVAKKGRRALKNCHCPQIQRTALQQAMTLLRIGAMLIGYCR
jgi:hypothetical protein